MTLCSIGQLNLFLVFITITGLINHIFSLVLIQFLWHEKKACTDLEKQNPKFLQTSENSESVISSANLAYLQHVREQVWRNKMSVKTLKSLIFTLWNLLSLLVQVYKDSNGDTLCVSNLHFWSNLSCFSTFNTELLVFLPSTALFSLCTVTLSCPPLTSSWYVPNFAKSTT